MGSNGSSDTSDLTLRLLRELRAQLTRVEVKVTTIETKVATIETKVATIETKVATIEKDVSRIDSRIDVLVRVVKDNHRVVGKRIRAVEIRAGARRPR